MDCFCLRKKKAYDFSSPYTMASSGTYRTSVVEDSDSKNGHVQFIEKTNGNHHDDVISENNHMVEDKMTLRDQNSKNDLQNDLGKDTDSNKDSDDEKDLSDVNRNHESQQNPEIVVEEVAEVKQVNVSLNEGEGHKRTSQVSMSSEDDPQENGIDRHSISEETKDHGEGHSDIVQGYSASDDLHQISVDQDVSYEEQQNVRNSIYSEDQTGETSQNDSDNDKKSDHTPSYDVTAAAGDVPKDVVHMY